MIPRYSREEMAKIWSEENRFKQMLEVEILACEAMAKLGQVPKSAAPTVRKKAKINPRRILEIEKTVKHDVIAFLSSIAETAGPSARFLHLGMTSSDVLDTATSVQLKQSCGLMIKDVEILMKTVKKLAFKYKNTPTMGRSHGVHAEPTTFGLKMASWYSELIRAKDILKETKNMVSFGQISGAVGTFAHLNPRVEEYVCRKLGLKPEPVSSQIIPRDRHAKFLTTLALVGGTLERFAVEIRHLQRTEVLEAEEPFTKGQKGSSAMPHKRNPILSENICGMVRLLRGYALVGMENVALWHERDISHSSAERIALPDASIALDFILNRMNKLLSGLRVYPENMKKNMLKSNDIMFSGKLLLKLVDKGLAREQAYAVAQEVAFYSRENHISMEKSALKNVKLRKKLSEKEIKDTFNISNNFKSVGYIFKRVFNK